MDYVTSKTGAPNGPHYAIVEFDTIHIQGDERSKTHPGHGYPAHTERVCKYIAFEDKTEWENEVIKRHERAYDNDFIAFEVKSIAQIKTAHTIAL